MSHGPEDTQDGDPSNMYLRAGWLVRLAARSAPEDREMLMRASRSLVRGARLAERRDAELAQIEAWLAAIPSEYEHGDPVHDEKDGILAGFRRGDWRSHPSGGAS